MKDSAQLLEPISGSLLPIQELALRLMESGSKIDPISGALCISHKPGIGEEAYALRIYPGITESVLSAYEEIHRCCIEPFYRELLQRMNGAHLFEFTLFGVPPTMARRPPQVDRRTGWPLDIGTAQTNWRLDYKSAPSDFFIGYGPHSNEEHVGYFLWPNGGVEAVLRNGDSLGQWGNFREFLAHELARAEAVYPRYQSEMERIMRRSSGWRGRVRRLVKRGF